MFAPLLVPEVVPPDECVALIDEMLASSPGPTPVLRNGQDRFEPTVRSSDSCTPSGPTSLKVLSRLERAARQVWADTGSEPGDLSGAHYFRYREGGFVAPHRDRSVNNDDPREVRWRQLSLVLFLNSGEPPDGFDGGALVVYATHQRRPTSQHTLRAQTGALALFDPGLVHEVTPVRSGTRYTVVTWLIERDTTQPKEIR